MKVASLIFSAEFSSKQMHGNGKCILKENFRRLDGDAMSIYNYVATAQKPTAVRFSLKGNFTRSDDVDLIVAKCNYIEVYRVEENSLSLQLEFNLYSLIESIEFCRLPDRSLDSLFVLTSDLSYCILSYDPATQSVVTEISKSLKIDAARVVDQPKMAVLDKKHELCIVNLYSGYLHAVPTRNSDYRASLDNDGKGKVTALPAMFSAKIDELMIISMVAIPGTNRPTIAILYQDHQEQKKIKLYQIQRMGGQITSPPELFKANAQPSDHTLIPVHGSVGGLLVVGEFMISYYDLKGSTLGVSMRSAQITAYCKLPGLTLRYLLGDQSGWLQVLTLASSGSKVTDLRLDPIGEISAPTGLVPFEQQKLFIGSASGDSLLVKLTSDDELPGITVLDTMASLAPITDFCFFDLDKQGRQKMVCCSGVDNDGSLRLVQSGVGFSEQTSLPIKGVRNTWALSCNSNSFHDTLVITTAYETRVFCRHFEGEEESMVEMDNFYGLSMDERTLALGTTVKNMLIQATASGVRLVKVDGAAASPTWTPPEGETITVAAVRGLQCLVAYGNGVCVYLLATAHGFERISETRFSHQVACADFIPVEDPSQIAATRVAIGLWGGDNMQYLLLPRMNVLYSGRLPSEVVPRSALLTSLEKSLYLFYALGDGQVIAYQVKDDKLLNPKQFTAGTHTPSLHNFNYNGTSSVFLASDNPAIIRSSHGNLIYSAVNMQNVTSCTIYNSKSFQDNVIISTDDSILVGTVDYRQKLHFTKFSLNGEMGRKILYHEGSRTFAVGTSKTKRDPDSGFERVQGWLRIFDARTFQVMSVKDLLESEVIESMTTATIGGQELLLVGTAIMNEREPAQLEGRVIAYQVLPNRTYKYVDAAKVPGVVYSINSIGNFAVLSINGTIYLLDSIKMEEEEGQRLGLVRKSLNQMMALCMHTKGEYLLVGDMIRSASVYQLAINDDGDPDLIQLAADFHPFWMTATGIVQDDIYLCAESSYNIFSFKRDVEVASNDRVSHLELAGGFYIGDLINTLREGTLAADLSEQKASENPPYIFATANGSIGVIASISESDFETLNDVETNLLRVLPNIGNLNHRSWRMVKCDTETGAAQSFIDGDLVESFLRLRPTEKQMVVQGANGGKDMECTVARLQEFIESFSRLR